MTETILGGMIGAIIVLAVYHAGLWWVKRTGGNK